VSKNIWHTVRDDDGEFIERMQIKPGVYVFVQVLDMWHHCGKEGDHYAGEVAVVDFRVLGVETIDSAKRSGDFDSWFNGHIIYESVEWEGKTISIPACPALAECCYEHGAKAPVWSGGDGRRWRVHRAARREARALVSDDAYEAALEKPVNAIGSSAREFMNADFNSAIARGILSGRPDARIMGKMHGLPEKLMDDARPDDWPPFVIGYSDAMGGRPKSTEDVSPEYHLGYERAENVKAGKAVAPNWIGQQQIGPHLATVGYGPGHEPKEN